jgi:5-oxoprolinase (ATP-hydrolysing) subunit C
MSGMIEVLQPGFGVTFQDAGRLGHRHEGVPRSGWLDGPLAQAANALVGNGGQEAVMELRGLGPELKVKTGPVRLALAGRTLAHCVRADGKRAPLPAWESATLQTGDRLQLGPADQGCAYLAVAGGWSLPQPMGSRSSYWRAGLDGVLGRALRPGDLLPCGSWKSPDPREWRTASSWALTPGPIRVVMGPQEDHFQASAIEALLQQDWEATAQQDRMGLRLRGPVLQHLNAQAADIVSDGVTPGAIQVPANGQPIVLLADSQTVGGYPKIATVISADLPRLAHLQAGTRLRFKKVTPAEARQALQAQRQSWQSWLDTRTPFLPPGFIDEEALYQTNLVSGMLLAEA